MTFRVWAPRATRVTVVSDDARVPLERGEHGYFELAPPNAAPIGDYFLSLDDGPPLPDPRTAHQPAGIHGPSRRVNHAAFAWSDGNFQAPPLAAGVVYELHVGTFSERGTFDGAIEHLDELVELGISHVELMPVCEFSGGRGWGYDGVNLFAPHHAYGGPEGLKRLVDACHARGLAVILDVVYNHLGPRGNHLNRFGPYFTEGHTPWGAAVNLRRAGSDEVRRFFIDNALMWLEDYHLDGLRLDAVQAFEDDRAFPFLAELARAVQAAGEKRGKHWELIAECDRSDPRTTRSLRAGGLGMTAQWSDDFQFALHAFFTGEHNGRLQDFGELADVAHVLAHGFRHQDTFSAFRGRVHGHPFERPEQRRLVGYLQTHDQVGNRPRGERFSALVTRPVLEQAAALMLLAPFVPMLFQGEEWAASTPFLYFTDHGEAALARDVKAGREREYHALGFDLRGALDPESEEAFVRSRLVWCERDAPGHRAVLDWYRTLIRLRRAEPDFQALPTTVEFDESEGWLVLDRGRWAVAVVTAREARQVPLAGPAELVLERGHVELEAGRVRVGPHGVAVFRRR
ncbi:MAG TPA: malto-oligosyltrehalose trehalohydrolase [Polyangiaceae bacterium]|nr:malto-oligosyltrehalose trehalohydrolase [Polyangiaceae bacterium]